MTPRAGRSGRWLSSWWRRRVPDGVDLVGRGGLRAGLTKQVLEAGLEVEMDGHLGSSKHAAEGRNHGNSRNGTRSKTVLTEIGSVDIDVPFDVISCRCLLPGAG